MKNIADSTRKLWMTLGLLALAVVLVIVIDSLPFSSEPSADVLSTGETDTSPDSTSSDFPSDSRAETAPPELIEKSADTVRLTFLGECAPGSPFATTAFGSLNSLTADYGTEYFFSAIRDVLAADDLTIAANTCLFSDDTALTASPVCAAPAGNASVYKDGSVEMIVDFTGANDPAAANDAIADTGVTVADTDGQYFEIDGIRIALFTTVITEGADHSALLTTIDETDADYVILYFYGGEENSHTVETWMRNALYTFSVTGVDLLVGAGNGVLRPCEFYDHSVIAYSLGSLIDGSQLVPENASALLQIDLKKTADGSVEADPRFVPCFVYGNSWQPALMKEEKDVSLVHSFLSGESKMPIEIAG